MGNMTVNNPCRMVHLPGEFARGGARNFFVQSGSKRRNSQSRSLAPLARRRAPTRECVNGACRAGQATAGAERRERPV